MDCSRARAAMHELLDTRSAPPDELQEHLRACADCAKTYHRLADAEDAVGAALGAPVSDARLCAVVDAARARAEAAHPRALPRPLLAWLGGALAFGLAMFACGAWLARSAWPREITVVRTEVRPQIVERVVEKRVEVRERIVVRRVR